MAIRFVNASGRAGVWVGGGVADVERASAGRFGSDPMQALARWDELRGWAEGLGDRSGDAPLDEASLGPCSPRPQKVFGIGLNYRSHAAEAKLELPKQPLVFTKFPNCLVGPRADVALTSERVDYEVELVAVIGRRGRGTLPTILQSPRW